MNCKINPILYHVYLRLQDTLEAEIVHRRRRKSASCIEVVFYNHFCWEPSGHQNTLPEAEKCGYWIICRPQNAHGKEYYRGKRVYQLFLSPVHPKKALAAKIEARQAAAEVSFVPVENKEIGTHICTSQKNTLPLCPKTLQAHDYGTHIIYGIARARGRNHQCSTGQCTLSLCRTRRTNHYPDRTGYLSRRADHRRTRSATNQCRTQTVHRT